MRKNFSVPSPKSRSPKKHTAPKAQRPMLNPDASQHANRLARPPRFPEIFEQDEDAPEDNNCCQSSSPVTRRALRRLPRNATCWHAPHSPLPLQAPIVATIQVDVDKSLLKQNKKRISLRQSGLITIGSGNSSSGSTNSSTKSRTTSPLRMHLAPRSARRYGGTLDLRKRKESTQRSTDTGELTWTRM
jgi:hypothetical protein